MSEAEVSIIPSCKRVKRVWVGGNQTGRIAGEFLLVGLNTQIVAFGALVNNVPEKLSR